MKTVFRAREEILMKLKRLAERKIYKNLSNGKSDSKVSVIVPVYNVEHYLAKCLDSLVNQSLQNIEIIVVNDGSKDGSGNIIQQYSEKYSDKIKALTKENGGLSDARNFGIDQATGDYLGFVDSDDYVSGTMFEEMLNLAEKNDAEMVICNIQKVDEDGNITQNCPRFRICLRKLFWKNIFQFFRFKLFCLQ